MSRNYLNTIFPFMETTTEKEREIIVLVSFSIILFLVCIIYANWMLPEYCDFFSSNELHGLACDGMRDWKVDPCPICEDKRMATIASFVFGLGIGFIFLPFVVFTIQKMRNRPVEQTKLFE